MTTPEPVGGHLLDVEGRVFAEDWKRGLCVGLLLGLAFIAAAILSTL
jgi:hypothetical protein